MKVFRDSPQPHGQISLLPACLDDWIGPHHPARVLAEAIRELDLSPLAALCKAGGAPSYPPEVLFRVLVFAYSTGLRSSRDIAEALRYDVRFMWLAEGHQPDFTSLCRFRRRTERVLGRLFGETVRLCRSVGLVLFETAAVDGVKLQADVSGRQTFCAARLAKEEQAVAERIKRLLKEAEEADAGAVFEREEPKVPEALKDARRRKEQLAEAARLQKEQGGGTIAVTDPESRVMKTDGRLRSCYNAQAVVDGGFQVVVAAEVTNRQNDTRNLEPMLEEAKAHFYVEAPNGAGAEWPPGWKVALADSGYWSQPALLYAKRQEELGCRVLMAEPGSVKTAPHEGYALDPQKDVWTDPGGRVYAYWTDREQEGRSYSIYRARADKNQGLPKKEIWVRLDGALGEAMREAVKSEEGRAAYRKRQEIVEPVFGHLRVRMGLRRLLLRGLEGARIEFLLACIAHNLGKVRDYARERMPSAHRRFEVLTAQAA